jgi:mRNA interferase MazF
MATEDIILLIEWCCLKVILAFKRSPVVFKQGDIWWCSLGMNIGEEVYGKGARYTRPVLIFKKLTTNSFIGLPLTSQSKQGTWYVQVNIHDKISQVMLNQTRILDKRRLISRLGTLDDNDFKRVKERFLDFFNSEK